MKLVIANITIHQDAEGRFSLNDLHKASGGEDRHSPDRFLRLEQTQSLVDEISNSPEMKNKDGTAGIPAVATKAGRYGGSFGCKEVIYAYANWISPAFYLKMIRTFDAVATGNIEEAQKIAKPKPAINPLPHVKAHLSIVGMMEKLGVRREMAMSVALKAIHTDTGMSTEGYRLALPNVEDACNLNQKQLGELVGLTAREIGKRLRAHELMDDDESGERILTEKGKTYGEIKPFTNNGHSGYEPRWRKEVLGVIAKEELAAATKQAA